MPARRMLIVDGDPHPRAVVGTVLRARGIDFDEARDGADGLRRMSANDYALIILEVDMRAIGGVDFLESLNVLQAGVLGTLQCCPDVIVTTCCTEDDLPTNDILRHGGGRVRAVLRKPVNLDRVVSGHHIRRVLCDPLLTTSS